MSFLSTNYDLVAGLFCLETGIMAPGKDVPAAMGETLKTDPMYRRGAFEVWCKIYPEKLEADFYKIPQPPKKGESDD